MPSIINSDNGAVSGSAGLKFDSADDGILHIQNSGNTAIAIANTGQATFTHALSQPGGFSFRNKIINGNFNIWQRGTSQTSSGYGSADRWACFNVGSTKTASRQSFTLGQTEVPGEPTYFMRHVVTSSAGASNYVLLQQRIESVRTLAGKTVTLSFWGKADSTKTIAIEFQQNFGTGGSPSTGVAGIEVNKLQLTSSWAKYTVAANLPSITGKTIGSDNNDFLGLSFWFDAGSSFNSRTDSLGQQSGTFDIAQVQLEEGSVAIPFEQRPIGLELSLCYRYCYVWNSSAAAYQVLATGTTISSTEIDAAFFLPVTMRATPTATFSASSTFFADNGTSLNSATFAFIDAYPSGGCIRASGLSSLSTNQSRKIRANNSTAASISFSSEL